MGAHLIDGKFQSDKYPSTPRGKVPLSVTDKTAQDLLWEYAQRRRAVDAEFANDLEQALKLAGFEPAEIDVPVLGAKGLTIPRAIWDEAWIAYCKEYSGSGTQRQHDRLLAEGFWVAELDDLVPNWRPLKAQLDAVTKERDALREQNHTATQLISEYMLDDDYDAQGCLNKVRAALGKP